MSLARQRLVHLPSRDALEDKLAKLVREAREVRLLLKLADDLELAESCPIDGDELQHAELVSSSRPLARSHARP